MKFFFLYFFTNTLGDLNMEKYRQIKKEMKELYEKIITSTENTESDIDKYVELKEQLFIAANEYKLCPGDITNSWTVAKIVDSGQYQTQGLGATKYARGDIKLAQLKFQQLGIPSEIEESSPAVEVPLERSAVQTFTSYKFKSKIFLNLLRNSSFTIIFYV